MFTLGLTLLAAVATRAAIPADEVTLLPGWTGALPSRMYSGYLSAGSDSGYDMFEHYAFIESENDPANDPVIVWSNGGPGASSFFGLMIELGPFYLSEASLQTPSYQSTGVPTLFLNEFRWSKIANILILNSPPPVGYSYCNPAGPSGDGNSCGPWNDTRTAEHNKIFLENWAAEFPEFLNNPWFLMGESYAGIYIPTLARALLQDPASRIAPKLRGVAVGDGCVGLDVLCGPVGGPLWDLEFLFGHGQFSIKLYQEIRSTCSMDELVNGVTTAACNAVLGKVDAAVGYYYAYSLYDECFYQTLAAAEPRRVATALSQRRWFGPMRAVQGALNDYPCGGPGALVTWITHPAVKAALHVAPDAAYFSGDNGVGFNYTLTERNLMPFYEYLATNTSIRVLIYNGDTDPCINSFRTQNWTSVVGAALGLVEDWRPWTLDGCSAVGGYVTRYSGNFDFLTIRGSGHMVPEYQPAASLRFLQAWLADSGYPRYNASCTQPPSA